MPDNSIIGQHAAVAIIPAAILADDIVRIENIPNISDVSLMIQTLDRMGAKIKLINNNTIEIDSRTVTYKPVPYELASHFRASYDLKKQKLQCRVAVISV